MLNGKTQSTIRRSPVFDHGKIAKVTNPSTLLPHIIPRVSILLRTGSTFEISSSTIRFSLTSSSFVLLSCKIFVYILTERIVVLSISSQSHIFVNRFVRPFKNHDFVLFDQVEKLSERKVNKMLRECKLPGQRAIPLHADTL